MGDRNGGLEGLPGLRLLTGHREGTEKGNGKGAVLGAVVGAVVGGCSWARKEKSEGDRCVASTNVLFYKGALFGHVPGGTSRYLLRYCCNHYQVKVSRNAVPLVPSYREMKLDYLSIYILHI